MNRLISLVLLGLVVSVLLIGCGSSRKAEPLAGPLGLTDPKLIEGQRAFMHNCHQCHPNGHAGLGPALNNKPLPTGMIKLQVRDGMGAMPAFSENKIPDPQLDAIAAYLLALRKQGG